MADSILAAWVVDLVVNVQRIECWFRLLVLNLLRQLLLQLIGDLFELRVVWIVWIHLLRQCDCIERTVVSTRLTVVVWSLTSSGCSVENVLCTHGIRSAGFQLSACQQDNCFVSEQFGCELRVLAAAIESKAVVYIHLHQEHIFGVALVEVSQIVDCALDVMLAVDAVLQCGIDAVVDLVEIFSS